MGMVMNWVMNCSVRNLIWVEKMIAPLDVVMNCVKNCSVRNLIWVEKMIGLLDVVMNCVTNCSVRNLIWVEKMIGPLVLRAVRYVICWYFSYYVPDGTLFMRECRISTNIESLRDLKRFSTDMLSLRDY